LHTISTATADLSAAKDLVCSAVMRLLCCQRAYIFEVDKPLGVIIPHAKGGNAAARIPLTRGIVGLVASSGTPICVVQAPQHQRFDAAVDDSAAGSKTGSILCVPFIVCSDAVLAVSAVTNQDRQPFDRKAEETLTAMVPFIYSALQNLLAISKRQELLAVCRAITAELELPQLYTVIADRACEFFDCEAAQLFLIDVATNELYLASGSGELKLLQEKRGLPKHVIETSEPVVLKQEVLQHAHFNPAVDQPPGVVVRNVTAWPIRNSKSLMGVLELINRRGGLFVGKTEEEQLLDAFVSHCSESIQNATVFGKAIGGYQASVSTQRKFQALLEVAESLALQLQSGDLVAMILQRARELVNAERSSLFLVDEDEKELVS
jgi:GAF domain-containing protein